MMNKQNYAFEQMRPFIGARLEQHHNWKGGRFIKGGYVCIKSLNHPFRDKRGYVKEHRLIMETFLGRYLMRDEEIHHINGNRQDNRIENLLLLSKGEHTALHNKITEERICLKCGSNETYVHKKDGYPVWFKHNNGYICQKCHDRKRYDQFRKKGVRYFG